mgnify:CR=1 FL=1
MKSCQEEETKKQIQKVIDQLYEEYVGIHLKSKKFIEQMNEWGNVLKPTNEKEKNEEKD